jgi:hypothetical protein
MGPTGDEETLARTLLLCEQGLDPSVEIPVDEICVCHGLEGDVDGRGPAVARHEGLAVDRIAEGAFAEPLERPGVVGDLLDQPRDLDLLGRRVVADRQGAGEALDAGDARQPSQAVREPLQGFEVRGGEDVVGLHHDHVEVVVAEVSGGLPIHRDARVVAPDQRLARRVHVDREAEGIDAHQRDDGASRHGQQQRQNHERVIDDAARASTRDHEPQEQAEHRKEGEGRGLDCDAWKLLGDDDASSPLEDLEWNRRLYRAPGSTRDGAPASGSPTGSRWSRARGGP